MIDRIFVDAERVISTGGSVLTISDRLSGEITTMRGVLEDIQSGWQSDSAAPAFAAGMLSYLDDADRLHLALTGHGDALKSSGATFVDAEADLATTMPGGAR